MEPRIFLACPTFDGTRCDGSANGIRFCSKRYLVNSAYNISSLMDQSFNLLWALALEQADRGEATHFAMIHSDVEPEVFWLDTFMDIMESRGCDLVSAVIPIKDGHGLTSTAISHPTDPWKIERRLTMSELDTLPETFGAEICPGRHLLVNNGLFLCDLRAPWCDNDELCNDTKNSIHRVRQDGRVVKRTVLCVPQDWQFSRDIQTLGGSVVATQKVHVAHHGKSVFNNRGTWGLWDYDREYAEGPLELPHREIGGEGLVVNHGVPLKTAPLG